MVALREGQRYHGSLIYQGMCLEGEHLETQPSCTFALNEVSAGVWTYQSGQPSASTGYRRSRCEGQVPQRIERWTGLLPLLLRLSARIRFVT